MKKGIFFKLIKATFKENSMICRHDMEAHLVFYTDQHGSFTDAVKRPFGLTVLAILFAVRYFFSLTHIQKTLV